MLGRRYAWYVLSLLTTLNFVNYVDRQMIVGMHDQFAAHFGLSDWQFGALNTSFFVVHAVTTLPLAWLADRFDRRRIIAIGAIVWSVATLATTWATGFASLLLMRGLVGLGEAAYLPPSTSILAESFRPDEKARTLGIFNAGMFAGACIGIYAGVRLGIPLAFQVVALPGIVLGLMAYAMRVPARRTDLVGPPPSLGRIFADAVSSLRSRTAMWMLLVGILCSFTAGAYITWFAEFIKEYQGLTPLAATERLFYIVLTAGPAGVLAGGWVADRLYRRRRDGRPLAMAIGFGLAIPCAIGALYTQGNLYYLFGWFICFFLPFYNGPMSAVIDDVVDDDKCSTAQAAFSTVIHLVGTAPGAVLVGWLRDSMGLREALLIPTAALPLAIVCCVVGSRSVVSDMDARTRRLETRLKAA